MISSIKLKTMMSVCVAWLDFLPFICVLQFLLLSHTPPSLSREIKQRNVLSTSSVQSCGLWEWALQSTQVLFKTALSQIWTMSPFSSRSRNCTLSGGSWTSVSILLQKLVTSETPGWEESTYIWSSICSLKVPEVGAQGRTYVTMRM